jgi:small subunit ribosomal protein S5
MNEEKKQPIQNQGEPAAAAVKAPEGEQKNEAGRGSFGDRFKGRGGRGFGPRRGNNGRAPEKKDEFEQKILDIARVTRVMAGGKRMRFRACVAIGDRKGKVSVGLGKGADVTLAVNKAVNRAKKEMVDVPIIKDTIPHEVYYKYCAAKILFKPASAGRGVKAGGIVRSILELAGVKNITSKILGSGNKIANARCTIEALKKLKRVDQPSASKVEAPKAEAVSKEVKAEAIKEVSETKAEDKKKATNKKK